MEKYLGENIPKLGFGLMRLPMDGEKIDVARTQEMVDRFLEEGFLSEGSIPSCDEASRVGGSEEQGRGGADVLHFPGEDGSRVF